MKGLEKIIGGLTNSVSQTTFVLYFIVKACIGS